MASENRECDECMGQGGGEQCERHGSGCPCSVEYDCESCDGRGFTCWSCKEPVGRDEVCLCYAPEPNESALPYSLTGVSL